MKRWFWKCGLGFNVVIFSFHKHSELFQIHLRALLSQMFSGRWTPLAAMLSEAGEVDLQTSVRCQRCGVCWVNESAASQSIIFQLNCLCYYFYICYVWCSVFPPIHHFLKNNQFEAIKWWFLNHHLCNGWKTFIFFQQKSNNSVLPPKKNVPNRPAPPYGKPS